MCEFCGDTKESAMKGAARFAADLKRLAEHYSMLSWGRIKPHTDECKKPEFLAKQIIRRLVEDWV